MYLSLLKVAFIYVRMSILADKCFKIEILGRKKIRINNACDNCTFFLLFLLQNENTTIIKTANPSETLITGTA